MKPVSVHVHWSENARFKDETLYPFDKFERLCAKVIRNWDPKRLGYDKTKATLIFDDGTQYMARLDLAPHDTHGFRHYLEQEAVFVNTPRFQSLDPESQARCQEHADFINKIEWD